MKAFAAIRKSPGGAHWIDIRSIDLLEELARANALQTEEGIPAWAKLHPVVRIAQVSIVTREPFPAGAEVVNVVTNCDERKLHEG